MGRTNKQERARQLEDWIALTLDADDAFVGIGERTVDAAIIAEVDQGRGALRRLWDGLVGERRPQTAQQERGRE